MLIDTYGGCLRLARAASRETCFIAPLCVAWQRTLYYHSPGRCTSSSAGESSGQHDFSRSRPAARRYQHVPRPQLVHPQDLSATLEAHRAFNRASLIRRTDAKAPGHAKDVWRYSGKNIVKDTPAQVDTPRHEQQNGQHDRSGFAKLTTSSVRESTGVKISSKATESRRTALKALPIMSTIAPQPHRPYKTLSLIHI